MSAAPVPWRRRIGALTIPLIGVALVLALVQIARPTQSPAAAAIGGRFSLTDQEGRTVTDADFRGKLMLIYFGYSFCPDLCPTTLSHLMQIYQRLTPAEQAQLAPIFITVDPERDTVAQLAHYVPSFSPALTGLTGSPAAIAAVTRTYHVYARKAGEGADYGVDHSSILYLMGKDGHFLRHFDGDAYDQTLLTGLRQALRQ